MKFLGEEFQEESSSAGEDFESQAERAAAR
jgi:hypothetical protein